MAAYQPVPPAPMIFVTIGKLLVNARGRIFCGRCSPQRAGEGHRSFISLPAHGSSEHREPCMHMSWMQQAMDKLNKAAASRPA